MTDYKVLITGAAGYIGSVLTREALALDYKVIAVDIMKEGLQEVAAHPNLKFLKKDLLSLTTKELYGVDAIFHLASIVGTQSCEKNPEEARRVNLEGTKILVKATKTARVVFTNTNIGYPKGKSDETATLTPTGIYSETKIEAEKMILQNGGVSVRLASVCGASPKMRDDLLLNFLVKQCVNEDVVHVYDTESHRNFIHVKDVAQRLLNNHQRLVPGEAYNLCIPAHFTKAELLQIIQQEMKKEFQVIHENKEDPDKRDYFLSMKKWADATHDYPKIAIRQAIRELIKYYEFQSI